MSQTQNKTNQQMINETVFSRNLSMIFMVATVLLFGNGAVKLNPNLAFTQQIAAFGTLVSIITLFGLLAVFFHKLAIRIRDQKTNQFDNNVIAGNFMPAYLMKVAPLHLIGHIQAKETDAD